MNAYMENLTKMMAIWNTVDAAEKSALAEAALEHNVHFVDPRHNIIGRPAFLAMVEATQKEFPGAHYGQSSAIGFQNNFCRYHWTIKMKEEVVMTGFDTVEVNDSGKILKVIGFFGELEGQPG